MEFEKQDKQKYQQQLKQLKEENKEYKSKIEELQIKQLSEDQKIEAINTMHSDKIRSLMTSIQVLKKQNQQLQKQSKEHKRSELIASLNKDIQDQDNIILVLRKLINDDKKCDEEIVKMLSKGPPKLRPLTREEQRMKIKELENQILIFKKNTKKAIPLEQEKPNQEKQQSWQQQQTNSQIFDSTKQKEKTQPSQNDVEESFISVEMKDDLLEQLRTLKNANEELKLMSKGEKVIIEKYEEDIKQKQEELIELRNVNAQNLILTNKCQYLEQENQRLHNSVKLKSLSQQDSDLALEQFQVQLNTKQTEIDTLKIQLIQLKKNNEETVQYKVAMETKIQKLTDQLKELQNQKNELLDKFEGEKRGAEKIKEEFSAFQAIINQLENQKLDLKGQIEQKDTKLEEQEQLINKLKNNMDNAQIEANRRAQSEQQGIQEDNFYKREKISEVQKQVIKLRQDLDKNQARLQESCQLNLELTNKNKVFQKQNEQLTKDITYYRAKANLASDSNISNLISESKYVNEQETNSNISRILIKEMPSPNKENNNSDISDIIDKKLPYKEGDSEISVKSVAEQLQKLKTIKEDMDQNVTIKLSEKYNFQKQKKESSSLIQKQLKEYNKNYKDEVLNSDLENSNIY